MNAQSSEQQRENISQTRDRMEDTIDAIASRLNGRHLIDEILGYFRSHRSKAPGHGAREVKEQVADSAGGAARAIVTMIREHPLPAALIGSGLAWLVYEYSQSEDEDDEVYEGYDDDFEDPQARLFEEEDDIMGSFETGDAASRVERRHDHPSDSERGSRPREGAEDMAHRAKDKFEGARHRLGARSGRVRERAERAGRGVRRRASRTGRQVRSGARDMYARGRDHLDRHPLEAGLIALAGGLITGLLTPNPDEFDEVAGPAARKVEDRLRRRAREAVDRGKEVASAAAHAAQSEATEQGLTPEHLKEGAEKVLDETRHAARDTAKHEAEAQGLTPDALKNKVKAVAHESKDAARETRNETGSRPSE
jgi:ElaB/YqjD/DUF883 family membrane-anchored ribosome-binding protein